MGVGEEPKGQAVCALSEQAAAFQMRCLLP